jgi:hypothetical protein
VLNFVLDTRAMSPTVELVNDTGKAGDHVTNDARVDVKGLEAGATWTYSLDGLHWIAGKGTTIPVSEFGGDGKKVAWVQQTDAAGNVSATSALNFTLDTTAANPTVSLRSQARDNYPLAGLTDFHAGNVVNRETWLQLGLEDGASWMYSTDRGQNFVAGQGDRLKLDVLKNEGDQEIRIRQQDPAGNWSQDTVVHVTVDNTAPTVKAQYVPAYIVPAGSGQSEVQHYAFQASEDAQIVFIPVGTVHDDTAASYLASWKGAGLLVKGDESTAVVQWREQHADTMYVVLAVDKAGNASFVPMNGEGGEAGRAVNAVFLNGSWQVVDNHVATAAPEVVDGRSIARSTPSTDHLYGTQAADIFSWSDRPSHGSWAQGDWIHGYSKDQGDIIELRGFLSGPTTAADLGKYVRKDVLADGTVSLWIDYDGRGETSSSNFDQQILVTSQAGSDLQIHLGSGANVVI